MTCRAEGKLRGAPGPRLWTPALPPALQTQGPALRAHPSGPRGAHLLALGVPAVELLGLGLSLHHRVHGLQVGRVGHQGQSDVSVRDPVDPLMVHAQVIFDVSRALGLRWTVMNPALPPQTGRQTDRQTDARPVWLKQSLDSALERLVLGLTYTLLLPPLCPAPCPSCPQDGPAFQPPSSFHR